MHPRPAHTLLVPVLALLLTGCAASAALAPSEPVLAEHRRPALDALAVLHRWDERRSAAYAAADAQGLRRLYSRGSWAGARDARILREYADRGLVVEGLANQVVDVELVDRSPSMLRLRVVERLAGGSVRSHGSTTALPAGRLRERVVTLVREDRGWVVRSVSPAV